MLQKEIEESDATPKPWTSKRASRQTGPRTSRKSWASWVTQATRLTKKEIDEYKAKYLAVLRETIEEAPPNTFTEDIEAAKKGELAS